MSDTLKRLWESSEQFFRRFDSFPPDLDAQLRCVAEETAELYIATKEAAWLEHEGNLDAHAVACGAVAREAADVIVTVQGVCMALGITAEQLAAAIEQVAQKNDSKTLDTHYVNSAGKIARREN